MGAAKITHWFSKTVDLLRPARSPAARISRPGRAHFSATISPSIQPPRKNSGKIRKSPSLLANLADALAALADWNHDACDHATRAVAEAGGVKAGLLINATRVAIVGQAVAPPLFDTMVVLGKGRVVNRLRDALREIAPA